jgi:hypothetical protein
MSGTVISGTIVTSTVDLSKPAYNYEVTLTGSGTISVATGYGIFTPIGAGTLPNIVNNGLVSAANNEGVFLGNGGNVTNSGTIYGKDGGIYDYVGTLNVNNYGTIIGGTGINSGQPYFVNAGIDIFLGSITNHTGALIAGADFGVFAYNVATITNDGTIAATGVGVGFGASGRLIESGTVSGLTAAVTFSGANSYLVVEHGAKFIGAVSAVAASHSVIDLAASTAASVLNMGGSFSGFDTIQIDTGAAWTLDGTSAELAGGQKILGFGSGDTIGLTDFAATSASYNAGILTLTGASGTKNIDFGGASGLASSDFVLTADGGGTDIALCFYPGTRLATPTGEAAVETLRAGDLVMTANGERPVRWIGRSEISLRFADRLRSLPVRVRAGALGNGLPRRDLLVSPDHALFLDGLLVQAAALVDGVNILRAHDVPEQFTYYHVELETHELLLAEGALTESFVDNVARMHFHNWDQRTAPDAPIAEMEYPRAKSARQVPRELRARLAGAAAA